MGRVNEANPSEMETRHCSPSMYIYASGMGGASALSSWSILKVVKTIVDEIEIMECKPL